MSTKVEQASTAEPRHVETTLISAPSAASTSTSKISKFTAKSGFVIPKNKLSGSLVPIYRDGKKLGGSDTVNKESTKQVQKKTRWGPDLMQDATARKGRALAYQIRVDQIAQQLKLGIKLEIWDDQDSPSAVALIPGHEHLGQRITHEKAELLELERREIIGEIIKLNPSYKAPLNYKPLLKEADVPIPIKEFPGYNYIGLIFGPACDTQKRLEKETGVKIQVYGTKASGEKGEITPSDGNEILAAYEEFNVHVSADTYEKVDAAVALIELLVTPVSVNTVATPTTPISVSGDNANIINQSQGTSTPYTIPSLWVNQGVSQPNMVHTQSQFQPYPGPWFQRGPPQTLTCPPSGYIAPPNPSAPILVRNPLQVVSSTPFNPSNMPSLFGPRPVLGARFGSFPQIPSSIGPSGPHPPVSQRAYMAPAPPLGHTGPLRNPVLPSIQSSPSQPNISVPVPFRDNQTGPPPIVRPLMGLMSQPGSRPSGPLPDRPLTHAQWSQPPAATAPLMVHPRGPNPITSEPIVASEAPPSSMSAVHTLPHVNFPSRPSASESYTIATNRPNQPPPFTSVPHAQMGPTSLSSSLLPPQVPALVPMRPVIPNLAPNPASGSVPVPSPVLPPPSHSGIPSSISGNAPNFTPVKSPVIAPKLQHPISGDFTFQPRRPQNPASQVGLRPNGPMVPAPQTPSFRPIRHNPSPQPVIQGFPRPQSHPSAPFVGNTTVSPSPIRPLVPQIGPRNFNPGHQMANMAGPFPPRLGNPIQLQQSYQNMGARPQNLLAPNQQFGGNPSAYGKSASSPSGKQQIYDPFSPTSASLVLQQGGNPAKGRKQESDPEYEDLMASVGVK